MIAMEIFPTNNNLIENFFSIIIIGGLLSFSLIIVLFIFNKLNTKKSLDQICSELDSKKTEEGKISVMKHIHSYLQQYTFEELLLFNLKYKGHRYFDYYYYLIVVINFISISIASLSPNTQISSLFIYLALLSPIPVIILPIIILLAINSKAGIKEISAFKLINRLFMNLFVSVLVVYFSTLIFVIMGNLIFTNNQEFINNLTQNKFLLSLKDLTFYFLNFQIESVNNQLSLAGFYFTLAVGGTVVLSLIDRYYKKYDSLKTQLLGQVKPFIDIYSEPNSRLNLNLSRIKDFDYEKIKSFHDKVLELQKKLECEDIKNNRIMLDNYNIFIWLIIITYTLGIITIFIPENFEIYSLYLFILLSIFFGLLTFVIYTDYKMQN
ncbi:hypothetical protein [Methanosarcina acetivorans]|uniref:Uncharacterized protein n=1 Tax=Methanosarcina acetivorans (strain ATCC 35395 / DSM 2834 / JCM 12185 / C2A) TaxID=188937 RepID=Q8TM64_METAC|nr:hypothetical protein [Methanosarcina acetivorans]AAM06183.1 predicted protein [Methanosarcina acetivorans C2A]